MPPSNVPPTSNSLLNMNGTLTPGATGLSAVASGPNSMIGGAMTYGDTNFDFFDPQNWMLDGLVDFSYAYNVPPLEGA